MKLLLDTHLFLWAAEERVRLSIGVDALRHLHKDPLVAQYV